MPKNIITIDRETSNDIEKLSAIIKDIGGREGCMACCSGDPFELRFEEMLAASSEETQDKKYYKYNKETQKVEEEKKR